MSDLTEILPQDSQTVSAIYEAWKKRGDAEPKRGYLGGSAIGTECSRRLWYQFRDCAAEEFEGRLYRLFNRGHREEPVFVDELRSIGCEVYEVGPDGEQFEITLFGGHFKGHADGVALGIPEAPKTWHLLEMKTSNSRDFAAIKKHGVQKHKPVHYAQMQIYMSELKLTRALYMVVCKETDALYAERVEFKPTVAKTLIQKAERIIFSTTPPERIADRPDAFACKWCPAKQLCHGIGETLVPVPELSCRQCCHATPEQDGSWSCAAGHTYGTPCKHHLMLPGLVHGSTPNDGIVNADGTQAIEFLSNDGVVWHHGSDTKAGQYDSKALMTHSRCEIELPRTEYRKEGKQVQPELEVKWSLENEWVQSIWKGKAEDLQAAWAEYVKKPMGKPELTQSTEKYDSADFGVACAIIYGNSAEIRVDTNSN